MRIEIYEFAEAMEKIMFENDSEKSDSWKGMPTPELDKLLYKEIDEYTETYQADPSKRNITQEKKEVIDIANICMMLWNRFKEINGGKG